MRLALESSGPGRLRREPVASVEQKRAVIRRMTDVLVEELGRDPEYVFVVIDEVDTDNWGRKGQSLTELWDQRKT